MSYRGPEAQLVAGARIGTRVRVATRKNPAALTYTKVGDDRWIEERNRRSRCTDSTDQQVGWWLYWHPSDTTVLDPIVVGVPL